MYISSAYQLDKGTYADAVSGGVCFGVALVTHSMNMLLPLNWDDQAKIN